MSFKDKKESIINWIENKLEDTFIENVYYKIVFTYKDVRAWFYHCCNREHFRFVWKCWCAYPFDFGYQYNIERAHYKDMLNYFNHADITTEENYEVIRRYLKLMIRMIDIIQGDDDLFDYDGDMDFVEDEATGHYILKTDNMVYKCNVKVNLKNICRFVHNEQMLEYCMEHPHELYQIKAKYIYNKIRLYKLEYMWD